MKLRHVFIGIAVVLTSVLSLPANAALNIILGNDDGCESAATHAAYQKLVTAGHHVIIAASMSDQSGQGGALSILRPITPLTSNSRGGSLLAGSPGVATLATSSAPPVDYGAFVFCVNSTPAVSVLYGIDVAAATAFAGSGGAPDLIISGPNYGNNTGVINNHSGTVNAALIAINRGIPAVAVSSAILSYHAVGGEYPNSADNEVADLVVNLVSKLEANKAKAGGALIPQGFGLNVNIPSFTAGTASSLQWVFSKEGFATQAVPIFSPNLTTDPAVIAYLGAAGAAAMGNYPGVSVLVSNFSNYHFISDTSTTSEGNVISASTKRIAVSVIQGNHQAGRAAEGMMRSKLNGLVQ